MGFAASPHWSSSQWQEKATFIFSSSGSKLKEAGQAAGVIAVEVAKDAKENVADAAERVGSVVKSRWEVLREPSTRHNMQERFVTAAALTSTFLKKGISETKEKMAVGKNQVEKVAKKTAQKSKIFMSDIERWQKGVASTDVFGVPIEVTVQRQQSIRPVPLILEKCADYLVASGLNTLHLFKVESDKKIIQHLVSRYNQDPNAPLPDGANPVDVAVLIKCYLASLPEPLTTFDLYKGLSEARLDVNALKEVLKKLPTVNFMTLELVTALLLRISEKAILNKMDARSLAVELAPVIMWQEETRPDFYRQYWNHASDISNEKSTGQSPAFPVWDLLDEEDEDPDASSSIPLDDEARIDFAAVEVIQCLIEHHNTVFTDAHETVWR